MCCGFLLLLLLSLFLFFKFLIFQFSFVGDETNIQQIDFLKNPFIDAVGGP